MGPLILNVLEEVGHRGGYLAHSISSAFFLYFLDECFESSRKNEIAGMWWIL